VVPLSERPVSKAFHEPGHPSLDAEQAVCGAADRLHVMVGIQDRRTALGQNP
jgi:hypothetical protein